MGPRAGLLAVVLACSGCTFISQSTFEAKRGEIDEDNDSVPYAEDCDDRDSERAPNQAERPYDGIDNDCGRDGDIVDLDGDAFPGVLEADYLALDPQEPYPEGMVGKPLDCIDDVALHPLAASIHPAPNANEVAYDGVDSDCDGANDFDVDGDGYLASEVLVGGVAVDVSAAFDAFVAEWGYEDLVAGWAAPGQATPLPGDCDDFEATVHPNPDTPDVWYDGIDQDCDRLNDFDQDGDGYMPPTLPDGGDIVAAYTQFIAFYFENNPPWVLPGSVTLPDLTVLDAFDDCLDEVVPALVDPVSGSPIDPATIYPRADTLADPWYDGVDTNCWADNDFDSDGDAFNPDSALLGGGPVDVATAYAAYVANWSYENQEASWGAPNGLLVPGTGDCKDDDPDTYPAALERLADGIDQDCDNLPDATAFTFGDFVWDRLGEPRIVRVGDTFAVAVTANAAELGPALEYDDLGVVLPFKLADARTGTVPPTHQFKSADINKPVDEVLDAQVVRQALDVNFDGNPDGVAWLGTTYTLSSNGYTYLQGRQIYEDAATGNFSLGASIANWSTTPYAPGSLTLAVDDGGQPYVMACADDLLHAIQGLAILPTQPELRDLSPNLGDLCFTTRDPYPFSGSDYLEYTRCTSAVCQEFTLEKSSGLTISTGPSTGESWLRARRHGSLQVLLPLLGGVLRDEVIGDIPVLAGETVYAADAMISGTTVYVAAILDRPAGPTVYLLYGAGASFIADVFPYQNPDQPASQPYDVALHADADRVMLAVTGRDPLGSPDSDTLGWAFLAP